MLRAILRRPTKASLSPYLPKPTAPGPRLRLLSSLSCQQRVAAPPAHSLLHTPAHRTPLEVVRSLSTASSAQPIPPISTKLIAETLKKHPWARIFRLLKSSDKKPPAGFGKFFGKQDKPNTVEPKKEDAPEENRGSGDGGGSGGSNKDKDPKDDKSSPWPAVILTLIGLVWLFGLASGSVIPPRGEEISFQEFITQYLQKGRVDKIVVVNQSIAHVYLKDAPLVSSLYFYIGSVDSFERKLHAVQESFDLDPRDFVPVTYSTRGSFVAELAKALPTLLIVGLMIWMVRNAMDGMGGMGKRGGKSIFSFGRSPHTIVKPGERTKVMFKDVAGLDEAKVEIMEFVKFLRDPAKFTKLGAKIPKGALLVGPPGTGKTLLAKATAGEASVPFFSISGSDFIEMFVGVGPSRVRDLFKDARSNAPCIVFIDEIDAVGRSRSKGGFSGGNDERENTLNQLLVEMDGFNSDSGVVVLAGTNRADILDKALLRPGRFDRQIQIDKPDIKGRKQIFMVHLKPLKLGHDAEDIANRLSALTPGFAGADIANVCNEAALIAARADKSAIELVDFEAAVDRVIGGLEKKHKVMTPEERKLVAYHEAGHAVCGWFLEHAHPVLKVTIVPRSKGALGFAQYLPQELALYNKDQLGDMMCMALGGRAAEQVMFGRYSTGAADDLQKVTKIAHSQVTLYGMSDKLGHVSFHADPNETQFTKPFSDKTAELIDQEVSKLVSESWERTLKLISEKKAQIVALAERLLKQETINHDVIVEILGPRPFSNQVYADYVARTAEVIESKKEESPKEKEPKEPAEPAAAPA